MLADERLGTAMEGHIGSEFRGLVRPLPADEWREGVRVCLL